MPPTVCPRDLIRLRSDPVPHDQDSKRLQQPMHPRRHWTAWRVVSSSFFKTTSTQLSQSIQTTRAMRVPTPKRTVKSPIACCHRRTSGTRQPTRIPSGRGTGTALSKPKRSRTSPHRVLWASATVACSSAASAVFSSHVLRHTHAWELVSPLLLFIRRLMLTTNTSSDQQRQLTYDAAISFIFFEFLCFIFWFFFSPLIITFRNKHYVALGAAFGMARRERWHVRYEMKHGAKRDRRMAQKRKEKSGSESNGSNPA